jgi:hypothetical protein
MSIRRMRKKVAGRLISDLPAAWSLTQAWPTGNSLLVKALAFLRADKPRQRQVRIALA